MTLQSAHDFAKKKNGPMNRTITFLPSPQREGVLCVTTFDLDPYLQGDLLMTLPKNGTVITSGNHGARRVFSEHRLQICLVFTPQPFQAGEVLSRAGRAAAGLSEPISL